MNKKPFPIVYLLIFLSSGALLTTALSPLYAQAADDATLPGAASGEDKPALPRSFRNFTLGMTLDETKAALADDSYFIYQGDSHVSFLPVSQQNVLESAGRDFILRGFFQFSEEALYVMSLQLNTAVLDHYSVYRTLVEKYGEPAELNPRLARWENDNVRLTLERPLTLKYIDRATFDRLLAESKTEADRELSLRRMFLEEL